MKWTGKHPTGAERREICRRRCFVNAWRAITRTNSRLSYPRTNFGGDVLVVKAFCHASGRYLHAPPDIFFRRSPLHVRPSLDRSFQKHSHLRWLRYFAMSFRKRNVGLVPASNLGSHDQASDASHKVLTMPGTRPSPLDGRSTTSTGATSLDSLFSGHAGLPLGCSLLVEENGTTDYAGTLLRYYAAEGLLQGHTVVAMGVPEQWGRDLPGVVVSTEPKEDHEAADDKMKIAWRYERLGQQGGISKSRGGQSNSPTIAHMHEFPHPQSSLITCLTRHLQSHNTPLPPQ